MHSLPTHSALNSSSLLFTFGGENKVYTTKDKCKPNLRIRVPHLIDLIKSGSPSNIAKIDKIRKIVDVNQPI